MTIKAPRAHEATSVPFEQVEVGAPAWETKSESGATVLLVDCERAGLISDGVYFDAENARVVVSMPATFFLSNGGKRGRNGFNAILGQLNGARPETYAGLKGLRASCNIMLKVSDKKAKEMIEKGLFKDKETGAPSAANGVDESALDALGDLF